MLDSSPTLPHRSGEGPSPASSHYVACQASVGPGCEDCGYAARESRSMIAAPLRILVAIMILEIPLISTATPTSVPIVQIALEGHLAKIRTPSNKLVAASAKNQPQ